MQLARIVCLTLGLFAIAACGTSLEDSCKEGCGRVCNGGDPLDADAIASCKTACTESASNAKKAGCEDEAEKLQTCGDEHACESDVNTKCSSLSADFRRCLAGYCFDNPDVAICQ